MKLVCAMQYWSLLWDIQLSPREIQANESGVKPRHLDWVIVQGPLVIKLIDSIQGTRWGFPESSVGKEPACNAGDLGSIPGLGRSLEKGKATHSSILAWRIPWTV